MRGSQRIYLGARYEVVRTQRENRPVVIKMVRPEPVNPHSVARLRGEYALLKSIDVPGVVKPLGFEELEGRPALILEDAGAVSLESWIRRGPVDIDTFLDNRKWTACTVALPGARPVEERVSPG